MKLFALLSIFATVIVLSGCAATLQEQHNSVANTANLFMNNPTDALLKVYPSAEVVVLDIHQNKFRYSVRYAVDCTFGELILAPKGLRNRCWVDVYYFSENGVITSYSMQRRRLY